MRMKILTVGRIEVNTDLTVPYLPSCGHVVQGKDITRFPGGSGVDLAVSLSKLGTDPILSGRVGDDGNGEKIRSYLNSYGVDIRYTESDALFPTGSFVRMTEDTGKSRGIRFDGANRKLSASDLDFAFNAYPMGAIVSADLPDEAVLAAAFYGAKSSVPVMVCDIADREKLLPLEQMKTLEIFMVSEENALRYTGIEPFGLDKSLRCCMALAGMLHAKYYIIKQGERGTFIYDGMYHRVVPSIESPSGNCMAADAYFSAALFAKYLMSSDIKAAVELATQAEAAARSKIGGATALPSSAELRAYISSHTATKT